MINWSIFDRIYCINFSKYTDRKISQEKELKRVGILDYDNFNWKYTIECPQYQILFDVMKSNGFTDCRNQIEFNIAMAHFECIKSAYEAGCERLLIIEDDIRFLKDLGKLEDIVNSTPNDFDVVLYDFSPLSSEKLKEYESHKINNHFARYDILNSTGCYGTSRKMMEHLIKKNEKVLGISDVNTSRELDSSKFNKYYAFESPTCQITYDNCNSVVNGYAYAVHHVNSIKKLDYSLYNIETTEKYDYGSMIK